MRPFFALFLLMIGTSNLFAVEQFPPILAMKADSDQIPTIVIEPALRDPAINKPDVANDIVAGNLDVRVSELDKALKLAKGPQKAKVLTEMLEVLAAAAYYYADTQSGKITPKSGDAKDVSKTLNGVRTKLIRAAYELGQASKNNADKARANYHVVATRFLSGQIQIGDPESLKSVTSHKQLSVYLDKRAKLLLALQDIVEVDSDASKQAYLELKSVGAGMSTEGAIVAKLAMAKYLVRVKLRGLRQGESNEVYTYYLDAASAYVPKLSPKQKDAVLLFSIAVWRAAEGSKVGWDKAPIKLKFFGDSDAAKALAERLALADWAATRYDVAIRKYGLIGKSFEGKPQVIAIDHRILDMDEKLYTITKNPFMYEKALLAIKEKYKNPAIAGKGREKQVATMLDEIQSFHRDLVFGEIGKDAPGSGQLTLKLVQNYLVTLKDPKEIEKVKKSIASIYVRDKQYVKAVTLYKELAKGNSKEAKSYFLLAAEAQSVVSEWPKNPPWVGFDKQVHKVERTALLEIYRKIFDIEKPTTKTQPNWPLISHVGLLEINLGRPEKAFEIWLPALKVAPEGPYAEQIAGFIITYNQKMNRWFDVESVGRICMDRGLKPKYQGANVDVANFYGQALFNIGKDALGNKKYEVAAEKLAEYTKKFKQTKNHDEALFLVASAYRALGKFGPAVSSLLTLVESYPKSGFYKQSLVSGGDMSRGMASEDSAILFYTKFLRAYPDDRESRKAREILFQLHLGRGERDKAVKINAEQVAKDGPQKKGETLETLLDFYERSKEEKSALAVAEEILKLSVIAEKVKAHALGTKVRILAKEGKIPDIREVEKALSGLKSTNVEIMEELHLARFILAERLVQEVTSDVTSSIGKDPLGALNKFLTRRKEVEASYLKLCEGGGSGYCGPGLFRLARFYERLSGIFSKAVIAGKPNDKNVATFNDKKKALVDALANDIDSYDNKAGMALASGATDPVWTREILWQTSGDWLFQRVSGEFGSGYIQWKDILTKQDAGGAGKGKKKSPKKAGGQKS